MKTGFERTCHLLLSKACGEYSPCAVVNKEGKIPVLVEFILQRRITHKEANRKWWMYTEQSAVELMNGLVRQWQGGKVSQSRRLWAETWWLRMCSPDRGHQHRNRIRANVASVHSRETGVVEGLRRLQFNLITSRNYWRILNRRGTYIVYVLCYCCFLVFVVFIFSLQGILKNWDIIDIL